YTFSNVTATHTISVSFAFVTPPSINPTAGNNQTTHTSTAFGTALTVLVTDGSGTPLSGRTVTFTVPGSGASATLSATTAITNAAGQVSVTVTANTTAGNYNVTASVSGTSPATFALTNVAGAASTVTLVSGGSQTAVVGATFAAPLVVRVTDDYSNPISGTTV